MFAALGAKFVATRIGVLLARVPRWVWIALAVVALVAVGAWWHGNRVEAFGNAKYQAGRDSRDKEIERLTRELDGRNAALAAEIRRNHDAQIRRNAVDADALRVRGPGKGACAPVVPPGSGGRDAAGGPGDAAVDQVHNGAGEPLIGLPFPATVSFAEQHDNFRTEALSWRGWHARFTAEWEAWRKKASAAER